MNDQFQTYYWGDNKHTKVYFRPFTEIPAGVQPTVSVVFTQNDEGILLSRPPRGWGLPGGHIEHGETLGRCFTSHETIREIHDGHSDFYAVMDYILDSIGL